MRLVKYVLLSVLMVCVAGAADKPSASSSAAAKAKKPQVLELIKPAIDLMTKAQEAYIEDDSKKAISLLREALAALIKVEQENPDLEPSPEFAPVRFRKAICETEIERILLDEAQASSRTIAVTDTRELEQMRADRKSAAVTNRVIEVTRKLYSKQSGAEVDAEAVAADAPKAEAKPVSEQPVKISEELEWAKDMILVGRFDEADQALVKVLKKEPENKEARFLMALSKVEQEKPTDALIVLADLMEDAPSDEAILLLAAGAHLATGAYAKAMEILDKVMKTNPQRPDAYLNMAWLLLDMRPDATAEAELYYRQGVKLGLVRNRDLERRLGIKQ
jgi:tetratricopeptide (TPR) repeat protein